MYTTPSPSKRPRISTSTTVSNTNSPFPAGGGPASRPHAGPRSVGPSGTAAGMSPADAFSPAPVDSYGMTGFTPYSTTSPAYMAGATGNAASPISAALAHGSRILSNIQAGSPFYNAGTTPMPMMVPPQAYPNRIMPMQMGQQMQQPRAPAVPQPGSPEYLTLALHHLQTTLLARLEADADAFFDAVDSAFAPGADTRSVARKAGSFQNAFESVLTYLDKNGLASIPILPLPISAEQSTLQQTDTTTATNAEAASISTKETSEAAASTAKASGDATQSKPDDETNKDQADKPTVPTPSLEEQISHLQAQAKDLFDRRQRLKESASIVTGILDS